MKEKLRKKNKAKSLCGLCAFDVLLVFSWEADNQSLTTSLYHLTGSCGGGRVGGVCMCVCGGGRCTSGSFRNCAIARTERTLEHKQQRESQALDFLCHINLLLTQNIFPLLFFFLIPGECVKLASILLVAVTAEGKGEEEEWGRGEA